MPRKKNYLLFLLGEFTPPTGPLSHIIDTLSLVIGSPYLKYVHHDNLIVAHFESYDSVEDIHFFLNNNLDESILSYFLIPKPRKLGMRLDESLEKHLTNLKKNEIGDEEKETYEKLGDNIVHINEVLEEYTHEFINKTRENSKNKDFTLNEVLDKITDHGIETLSVEEREFLDRISKK